MLAAGIGLILLGYAFLYSGASNIATGGNGIGFINAISGKNPQGAAGAAAGAAGANAVGKLFSSITPQGNSGASQPSSNSSPVSGVESV